MGGGTPPQVPPIRSGWGVPPIRPGSRGVPHLLHLARWGGGYPTSGTPPSDLSGGTPTGGGVYPTSYRITDGVLDTPRSEISVLIF